MQSKLIAALESAGLPVHCCPACGHSDWTFAGDTTVGFEEVRCRYCSREYRGMLPSEEYVHWADKARQAAHDREVRKLRQAHARLKQLWDSYYDLVGERRLLVCVNAGRMGDDDDEIPF